MARAVKSVLFSSLVVLFAAAAAHAGSIWPFAGGGPGGPNNGDGLPASQAQLASPNGVAVDLQGNVYIADTDHFVIRRVDALTGIISTFAGNGNFGYSGNGGPATGAELSVPFGIAVDVEGNVYFADTLNSVIRRVSNTTGVINTVAGNGGFGYSGDGVSAIATTLSFPEGVCVDLAGNVYIADTNNYRVRRVGTNGIITTIAGNGFGGFNGDGGPAVAARLSDPRRVATDAAGNVYILDRDAATSRVRRVDIGTGIIQTVAGGGTGTGESGPAIDADLGTGADLAVRGTDLYVANTNRVWRVSLVDGTISVLAASFQSLGGVGSAADGSVYICDALANRAWRVESAGPVTVIINANTPPGYLAQLTQIAGSMILDGLGGFSVLLLPNLSGVGEDFIVNGNPDLTAIQAALLTNIGGDLEIGGNPMLGAVDLTSLTSVGGSVSINGNNSPPVDFTSLTGVGGSVSINGNNSPPVDFTSLTGVGGSVSINGNNSPPVDLTSLTGVGGSVSINGNNNPSVDLTSLTGLGGSVAIENNNSPTVDLSSLTGVGGHVAIENNNTTAGINLTSLNHVGGSITIAGHDVALLNLSSLATVTGGVTVSDNGSADIDLSALGTIGGTVSVANNNDPEVDLSALGTVGGSVVVTNNNDPEVDLSSLGTVGGTVTVTNNNDPEVDLSSLGTVGGTVHIGENNGTVSMVTLSSLQQVEGDLILETQGQSTVDVGGAAVGGNSSIQADGATTVSAQTAEGTTDVGITNTESSGEVSIPDEAFPDPTPFTMTHEDPQTLPPVEAVDPNNNPLTVDPVAAYRFNFATPTLAIPALLTITIDVQALDPVTRAALLAALDDDAVTIAVQGDGPSDPIQTRPVCIGGQEPTPDGCVSLRRLDANQLPLPPESPDEPAFVQATALITHFSRYALVITSVCPADFNADALVDDADFVVFAAAYDLLDCADPIMPPGCPADLNRDAFVDDTDFVGFAAAYDRLLCE